MKHVVTNRKKQNYSGCKQGQAAAEHHQEAVELWIETI